MTEEKNLKQARSVFMTICKALDNLDFKYQKDEDDLHVTTGARGEDLPMEIRIKVIPEISLVTLTSVLPVSFSTDKMIDGAVALAAMNFNLILGNFDLDLSDGMVAFRMTNSFKESLLSVDLFEQMIMISFSAIDNYNDKLFMISKGFLSVTDYISSLSK